MTPPRARAPQLTPDERRQMIVSRTVDLVAKCGQQVTTRQIAQAAGIGEGTIFRVFTDKEELLQQCLLEAMRMAEATAQVEIIELRGTLSERLTTAATVLRDHISRAATVAAALGTRLPTGPRDDRDSAFTATRDALVRLMEPERTHLTHPPEQIAVLIIGLLFERSVGPAAVMELSVDELISIVLHGALASEESEEREPS